MYPSDVLYAVEEGAQIAQLLTGQGNPLLHGVLSVRLIPPFPQIVPGRRSGERHQIQLKGQGTGNAHGSEMLLDGVGKLLCICPARDLLMSNFQFFTQIYDSFLIFRMRKSHFLKLFLLFLVFFPFAHCLTS